MLYLLTIAQEGAIGFAEAKASTCTLVFTAVQLPLWLLVGVCLLWSLSAFCRRGTGIWRQMSHKRCFSNRQKPQAMQHIKSALCDLLL